MANDWTPVDDWTPVTVSAKPGQVVPASNPVTGLRLSQVGGNAFVQGAIAGTGLPGQIETGMRSLVNQNTGYSVDPTSFLPTGPRMTAAATRAGVGPVAEYAPRTPFENYVAAGASGAGAALPLLPFAMMTGGASTIPFTLASGAGGNVGGLAAKNNLSGVPGAETVGSLLGGGIFGGGEALLQRGTNSILGNLNPNAQAFADAGIPSRSAAFTSMSPATRKALAPYAPVDAVNQDLGKVIEGSAAMLGSSRTLPQAGLSLQDKVRNWLTNVMPAKENNAWAPIDAAIPNTTPTPLNKYKDILGGINIDAGPLQGQVEKLRPTLPAKLQDDLDTVLGQLNAANRNRPSGTVGVVEPAVDPAIAARAGYVPARKMPDGTVVYGKQGQTQDMLMNKDERPVPGNVPIGSQLGWAKPGGTFIRNDELPAAIRPQTGYANLGSAPPATIPLNSVDWGNARALRSALGNALNEPSIVRDIGEQNLRNLYRGITEDLGKVAKAKGVGDQFAAANTESTRLNAFKSNIADNIVSTTNKTQESITPEQAATSMLSGTKKGGTNLATLRGEIPDAVDDLAAVHLRKIGLDNPDVSDSIVSKNFMSNWKTMSPEAKEALVNDPAIRNRIEAAASVQANIKSLPASGGKTPSVATVLGFAQGGAAAGILGSYLLSKGMEAGPEILSGAAGELGGTITPFVREMMRSHLAGNALVAKLAGANGPRTFKLQGSLTGLATDQTRPQ